MRPRMACWMVASVIAITTTPSWAQLRDFDAQKLGLEVAWRSQAQLPRYGAGLVSSHIWVEKTNPRKFAVVSVAGQEIRIPATKLDRYGDPIGIEGAKAQATEQAARLTGKPTGFQVEELNVPRIKLVLVTSDGLVQTLDAESGNLLWTSNCGQSDAPAYPAAVSEAGISVLHGAELYLLDWETGKHRSVTRMRSLTSNTIAICNETAFVCDFKGVVNTYGVTEKRDPWSYVIQGRSVGRSVSLADQSFCAIASGAGYMFVFNNPKNPTAWIRFQTSSPILGSLATGNGAFYVGTMDGVLAKVTTTDRFGIIEWELHSAQPIITPALVIGDTVYFSTESGTLIAVDDTNGLQKWRNSLHGITEPLAVCGSHLICRTAANETVSVDLQTGELVGKSAPVPLSKAVINPLNDRAYIIAKDGRVQCLRAPGADMPTLITPVITEDVAPQPAASEAPAAETEATPATNIFGGFGNNDSTSGSTDNPFGTGAAGDATGGDMVNPFAPTPTTPEAAPGGNPFGDF
ncbi:outer membrane protein assembly factor BamB family protein [Aureliella helgolandensis]|uniref:Outer membrane biogenesis protein BamB n=1 Tax=Aureliella helgolandensis TaxID=2527968 RepID=A0A518GCK6_9BACT|nr:PQQ-binding-like beta-propeller repeat protein [Aureliella helgolandensis]QDV26290.1 outer membrane biogenesis protein BamB [Aureliella helgolandensis]